MLSGKTAVVNGSGRNIGKGIAQSLAEHGASVAVNDIEKDRAEKVTNELPTNDGQTHISLVGDATKEAVVKEFVATVADEYQGLDILVNNLAYAVNKNIFDTTFEEWQEVQELTLYTMFLWTKHFGQLIVNSTDDGSIVNLASALAHRGISEKVAYCAAKGGVVNMTRQLSLDFAEYGVRVNSISPGLIGDPVGVENGASERDPNRVPLGRLGKPEDIGNVSVFLCSDYAGYVTGEDILVTGGLQ